MKTIQDLKTKYNKEIEILVRTQVAIKVELKNLKNSENWGQSLPSRMDQVEDRTSELEDKVEELDNPHKEYLKNEKHMKGRCWIYWTIDKQNVRL